MFPYIVNNNPNWLICFRGIQIHQPVKLATYHNPIDDSATKWLHQGQRAAVSPEAQSLSWAMDVGWKTESCPCGIYGW